MTTLLILLLGTVLIQGSAIVAGQSESSAPHARGLPAEEFQRAISTMAMLVLACVGGYLIEHRVLAPAALAYLRTPMLLLLTALIYAATRWLISRSQNAPQWPKFSTYATHNIALFGLALFGATTVESFRDSLAYGLGAAVAFSFLNAAYFALRDRIAPQYVPFVFRGIPVALVTAGLMALALFGFVGLVRH